MWLEDLGRWWPLRHVRELMNLRMTVATPMNPDTAVPKAPLVSSAATPTVGKDFDGESVEVFVGECVGVSPVGNFDGEFVGNLVGIFVGGFVAAAATVAELAVGRL